MSLLGATILTAVATLALAVFAFITAIFAWLAFRKQSKEVSDQAGMLRVQSSQLNEQRKINVEQARVLQLQAKELQESLDDRKRETEDRRRDQAVQVYMVEVHATRGEIAQPLREVVTAFVHNTSRQPVYDLRFSWRRGDSLHNTTIRAEPLMPDGKDQDEEFVPSGVNPQKFGAVVIFRDRAGLWWRAHPDGRLDELPPGAEPPHSW